jgi:gliding motility-associated-like protein
VYTVTKPGEYIVELGTHCGGTITDTVNIYNNKIGGFGPVSVCGDDTVILQAPGGYTNYQWGPDYALIPINDTAVAIYPSVDTSYILRSATPDGCQLKDTIVVDVWKAPVVQLGGDTTICTLDQLYLNAGAGYKSYLWSTGSDSSGITVSSGTYSVQVVDVHGCKAGDTIVVQSKNCPEMLAVPNAFSPDGNGVNDIFKPHIEGRLDEYYFVVFNRWGEIEFSTHDPAAGWDGRFDGVVQNPGTYAWMCRFKFSGQGVKMDKGTVILVR